MDTVLVSSAIIMGIPMTDDADKDFYATVKNGDRVLLNATMQTIEILDKY